MNPSRRWLAQLGLLMLGVVLAAGSLLTGPDRVISCSSRSPLDRLLGEEAGHIDGPSGGGACTVPATGTWIVAGAILVGPAAMGVVRHLRRKGDEER